MIITVTDIRGTLHTIECDKATVEFDKRIVCSDEDGNVMAGFVLTNIISYRVYGNKEENK